MAWIDYKKAYDMAPHSWISDSLEMCGVANNVQDFLNKDMEVRVECIRRKIRSS